MKAKEIVGQAAGDAAAEEYEDLADERAERSGLWEFSDVETLEFEGKIFALTGFGAQEESDLTKRIEERGGSVKSSLVVKTDYLIVMEDYDHQTTKYRKAKELQQKGKNVAILSSKQFYDLTAEE